MNHILPSVPAARASTCAVFVRGKDCIVPSGAIRETSAGPMTAGGVWFGSLSTSVATQTAPSVPATMAVTWPNVLGKFHIW